MRRDLEQAQRALSEAANELDTRVKALGFELGVEIAGWDEKTGTIFEKPPETGQAPALKLD